MHRLARELYRYTATAQGWVWFGAITLFSPERNVENEAIAESLLAFVGYRGPLETLTGALPHVDKRLVVHWEQLLVAPYGVRTPFDLLAGDVGLE